MPYVGRPLSGGKQWQKLDTPTTSSNAFTMQVGGVAVTPAPEHVIIAVNGVIQEPDSGFTISGSTLTFTGTVVAQGTDKVWGMVAGDAAFAAASTINEDRLHISNAGSNGQFLSKQSGNAGGLTWATVSTFDPDGAATFNDTGADVDFRVEGSGEANALFVQGSDGNVGIGTASPATALHVASGAVDTLTVASSVDGCKINMKDSGSTAGIDLYADDENFGLYVNDALKFYIGSTGAFSMGSNLQFSEAARGTLNNISNDNFQTIYTPTFDGSWMVVCRISDGDGASFFVFHRTQSGGTRRVDVSHEHQCDGRWDNDKIEISQFTGGGSLDIPYVVYRIL